MSSAVLESDVLPGTEVEDKPEGSVKSRLPAGSGDEPVDDTAPGSRVVADDVLSEPSRSSSVASSLSDAGDSPLMKIVKTGLEKLASKFLPDGTGDDNEKNAAANFIKALNDNVNPKVAVAAKGGRSRRALKRIMKKYSRRVSRKRGKRVKSSAQ
jgi:hypothetical protein